MKQGRKRQSRGRGRGFIDQALISPLIFGLRPPAKHSPGARRIIFVDGGINRATRRAALEASHTFAQTCRRFGQVTASRLFLAITCNTAATISVTGLCIQRAQIIRVNPIRFAAVVAKVCCG